jgi:peptidoglycan/LPS O-acetylase OafA/YrhL
MIASIIRYRFTAFAIIALVSLLCLHNPLESLLAKMWTGAFLPQQAGFFVVGIGLYFLTAAPLFASAKPIPFILPKFFVWLGDISYSTYVLHWSVLAVVNALMPALSRPSHIIILSLISIPIILPLSYPFFQSER